MSAVNEDVLNIAIFSGQMLVHLDLQTADDIANAAVFLASPEAREITGAALNVGGGVVMDWRAKPFRDS